ncbi:hypothetical protein [Desulfovibrio sp.]|uniref:hypothetical protein n=2 Tax=Desulfovibrio TaxID=872 RepID=UPI003D11E53B
MNSPAIRFAGFTEDWEQRKLSSIATIKARIGWQGLTQKEFLDDGDYYLITGTDFAEGTIDFPNCHYIGEDRYRQDTNIQEKWVHFFGPVNGKTKVDSFIGYAAHLGLIRGGTPSGLYC